MQMCVIKLRCHHSSVAITKQLQGNYKAIAGQLQGNFRAINGSYGGIMGQIKDPLWYIMVHYGKIWYFLIHAGTFWYSLEVYCSFL